MRADHTLVTLAAETSSAPGAADGLATIVTGVTVAGVGAIAIGARTEGSLIAS